MSHSCPNVAAPERQATPKKPAAPIKPESAPEDDAEPFVLMLGGGEADSTKSNTYFECKVETEMEGVEGKTIEEDTVLVIPKRGMFADRVPAKTLSEKDFFLNLSGSYEKYDPKTKKIEMTISQIPMTKRDELPSLPVATKKITVDSEKEFSLSLPGQPPLKLVTMNCKPADPKTAQAKKTLATSREILARVEENQKKIMDDDKLYGPMYRAGLTRFMRGIDKVEPESERNKLLEKMDKILDRQTPVSGMYVLPGLEFALRDRDMARMEAIESLSYAKEKLGELEKKLPTSKQDILWLEREMKRTKDNIQKTKDVDARDSLENKADGYIRQIAEIRGKVDFDKLPDYDTFEVK